MNKNKGFIGIGLIIAIVLGIAVVGGGAYYLGKSNSKQEVKSTKNILPNSENQNLLNDNNKQLNTTTSTTPSITVLSPNGGESYKAGDKITVKWKSDNLSKTNPVQILLVANLTSGDWNSSAHTTFDLTNDNSVLNSGSATFILPTTTGAGNYYKIYVSDSSSDEIDASDYSDKTFTINSMSKNVSTTSCTSDKGNSMTFQKALEIAKKSSCATIGNFTGEYDCNQNAGGLVDVYMNPSDHPSCSFACRVSIDTEKVEEGWMCTGSQ